jgi:hypothetical protein
MEIFPERKSTLLVSCALIVRQKNRDDIKIRRNRKEAKADRIKLIEADVSVDASVGFRKIGINKFI